MDVAIQRGDWLDPRSAQVPLATRGVPVPRPAAVADDAGDVPPRPEEVHPAQVRRLPLGRLPADEIENLRRMLEVAVQKRKLPANPCDRVEPPPVPNER